MSGRTTNVGGVVSLLGAFLAAAVITGFLSAGLFMPAVGAVGGSVRTVVDLFDSLPDNFTTSPLAEQSVILASDGTKLATPYDENRVIVPLAEIAQVMRTAQVAIEDHRFYEHGGADLQGILRAFISNKTSGEVTGGGSTLTQQYVKITLQENALRAGDKAGAAAAVAQNYGRKIQELKYAIQLEKTLTKDQILEGYLNLVYYGDRAYGVEAASQHYFGHGAKTLNLPEAALLAGIVQNPGTTDPVNFPDKSLARRNVVLDRMKDLGLVTDADWKAARAVPLSAMLHVTPAKNSCQSSDFPYFCDYVLAWLKQDPSLDPVLGRGEAQRVQAIYRGGLTIQTTLDPAIARAANEEISRRVPIGNDEEIGAATAVLDAKTGGVKAIGQNTTYAVKPANRGETAVNWAVDSRYGGSIGFSFGSTAKIFTLVTALEAGWPTTSSVYAKGASPSKAAEYTSKEIHGACGLGGGTWSVRNDLNFPEGDITLAKATAQSINTAFVGMTIQLGGDPCKIRDTGWRMGLHQGNGKEIPPYPSAIILGTWSASPMTMASVYQTIANEGVYCPPRPVMSIVKDGKALALPALGSACEKRVDPEVARGVTSLLQGVLDNGGTADNSPLAGGRQAAGKTGTTDGKNETWFVGYTPQLSTAVWVGTPDDKGNSRVLSNVCLRPMTETKGCSAGSYRSIFGATLAAPVWKAIMDRALAGQPKVPFTEPGTQIVNGEKVDIPDIGRRSLEDAKALLLQAGFVPSVVRVYSNYRVGTVVGTTPRNQATRGSVVRILVSQGPAPAPVPVPTAPPPGGAPLPAPTG
jgi:membrane peptidoglycan carboxypeptidase